MKNSGFLWSYHFLYMGAVKIVGFIDAYQDCRTFLSPYRGLEEKYRLDPLGVVSWPDKQSLKLQKKWEM